MSGKDICQNDCQPVAPSTLADSRISQGNACSPARRRSITNGMEYQASIPMMLNRAIQGVAKKAGWSQPSARARF